MTHDPRETLDTAVEAACYLVLQAQHELHEWLEAKGYAEGYATALDAAREAVVGLNLHGCMPRGLIGCNCIVTKIIAAIDKLRDAE